jgi:PKD domain-containing protein/PEGA domain-containing protein
MSCEIGIRGRRRRLARGLAVLLSALLMLSPGSGFARVLTADQTASLASVIVRSDPVGASVYVDGRFVGATPINVDRLAAGDHRVRIVKPGYLENGRVVRTAAGRTSTVEVTLTRDVNVPAAAQVTGSTGDDGGVPKWVWWAAIGGGVAATAYILANRNSAPVAGTISASPSTALQAGTTVTFTSQGASDPDGDSLTYSWDFGDGSTGTGQTTTKVYSASGTMNVTLTVSDGKKDATATTSVTVRSLTGIWTGFSPAYGNTTASLTQTGSSISGSWTDQGIPPTASITGSVTASAQPVLLNLLFTDGTRATYTASVSADVNTLSGTYVDPGATATFTLTRR